MNLSFLWQRLLQVKMLEVRAESLQPVWSGTAFGDVALTATNQDVLIFSETGEWKSKENPQIKFFNIYRWEKNFESIELSHLRNGIDKPPVHLLDFEQQDDDKWHSRRPHHCHEDIYTATLSITGNTVELDWKIAGPAKEQNIKCLYR